MTDPEIEKLREATARCIRESRRQLETLRKSQEAEKRTVAQIKAIIDELRASLAEPKK